jgi:hypothetical protein
MGTYNIRLGSQLSFDEQQEADIIKAIETMNASHKSGQFISNLIRIAFDCPEIMDNNNGKYEKGAILKAMENSGLSYNRQAFMYQITKEVDAMKKKVDEMYSIILKTYMLGQMGKHLGLEEKADNELMAQFVIEKQLKELQDALGISLTSSVFASNRKQDIEKIADDALEYIIESYSGIVNELKTIVNNAQTVQVQTVQQPVTQFQQVNESANNVVDTPVMNVEQPNVEDSSADNSDEDEIIDFGNADFGALGSFFGEQ